MNRRGFITWVTAVGATLTLPTTVRPTRAWKPAQVFWVRYYESYSLTDDATRIDEMWVPAVGRLEDAMPPFSIWGNGQWEKRYTNPPVAAVPFPLGGDLPDGLIK